MSGWTREISQALAEYEDELDDENYIEEHTDETEDGLGGRSWVYESTSRALPEQTETTAVSLGAHESRCRTSRVGPRSSASPHQARGVKEHPSRTTRTDLNAPCSASLASAPKEHQTVLSGGGSRTATNCQTRNRKALSETVIDSVRRHISVVFCGHVDAGKSTLMAQTLVQLGQVSEQELRRVERDANQAGKESFRLAWMLDSEEYERAHGVTVDVAIRKASLSDGSFSVSFLDCPGHRDFVTAFLRGAFLADVGVLVVDARPGALESGLSQQGQTLQHARILRHIGLDRLLVAVNKMDICAFDESRFLAIREKLDAALRSGLDWDDITYIPCSGITGENITHAASDERLRKWYQEPHYRSLSFLDAIQQYQQATADVRVERLRDTARFVVLSADEETLTGSLLSGSVEQGSAVTVLGPHAQPVTRFIKRIVVLPDNVVERTLPCRFFASLYLAGGAASGQKSTRDDAIAGRVLAIEPQDSVIRIAHQFRARLWGFPTDVAALPGQRLELYTASLWGVTVRLLSVVSDRHDPQKRSLRKLPQNAFSIAEIAFCAETDSSTLKSSPPDSDGWNRAPIALANSCPELGCFILRLRSAIVATGQIIQIH